MTTTTDIDATTDTTITEDATTMTVTDTRPAPAGELVPAAARAGEVDQPSAGALALRANQTQWTADQHAALVQLGVEKAGPANLKVFMHVAQRTGLDPFSRQIYMIGRYDSSIQGLKWTIQTGIDGFRIIADRRPEYRGQTEPQWCGDDGVWRDVWLDRRPPVAARIGVHRSDFKTPIYAVALFREFAQYRGDRLTTMWHTKPAHMIAKCAEAGALRKAFPNDLGGLYTDDEMPAEGLTFGDTDGVGDDPDGVTPDELAGPESTIEGEAVDTTPTVGTVAGGGAGNGAGNVADGRQPTALPELSEDEAAAFYQYCQELPGVTTEAQVRRAWAEAAASQWLNRPIADGDGLRVGDVLTEVARRISASRAADGDGVGSEPA